MLGPIARAEEPVMVPPATARVAVVTDDAAGVIRFVIDGKEVARVDAAGLNVEGDVTYSGGLNDRGPAVTEGAADPKGGEAGDER